MKDKAGKTIEPGDLIIYGQALGRCASLNYGKVISTGMSGDPEYAQHPTCRFIGLTKIWSEGEKRWTTQKPATLHFSERILIVSAEQVDERCLCVLDTIIPEP